MPERDLELALRDLPRPEFKRRLRKLMEPQTVVPYITVRNVEAVIEFATSALGGEELLRTTGSAGGTHCEIRFGDSKVMFGGGVAMSEEMPTMLHFYVPDVDAAYARAVQAGAKSLMAPVDQEYGDRDSVVVDPGGTQWCLATSRGPQYRPAGMRNVTMYLHPFGTDRLIDFAGAAFGAQTLERHAAPDGTIAHAKIQLGNTIIEMGEGRPEWPPMPTMIHFTVADADASYERAIGAGAKSLDPPRDQAYGARMAGVEDPFGNKWYLAGPPSSS
jgi:uncharacterized glyoxalase superfamily protein PhnB